MKHSVLVIMMSLVGCADESFISLDAGSQSDGGVVTFDGNGQGAITTPVECERTERRWGGTELESFTDTHYSILEIPGLSDNSGHRVDIVRCGFTSSNEDPTNHTECLRRAIPCEDQRPYLLEWCERTPAHTLGNKAFVECGSEDVRNGDVVRFSKWDRIFVTVSQ